MIKSDLNDKCIILTTVSFPYGNAETWLETEILFLAKSFKKVIVIPYKTEGKLRAVPSNVILVKDFKSKFILNILRFFSSIKRCRFLIRQMAIDKNITFLVLQFWWALTASAWYKRIENLLKKETFKDVIIYSQWFNGCATALALLKSKYPNVKTIVKCHGWDVYEDRLKIDFYPFRKQTIEKVDKVFAISDDGNSHLASIYPSFKQKIETIKLGVFDHGFCNKKNDFNVLKIVSCSNLNNTKRIHLIIDALSYFNNTNYNIEWHHIGSGELQKTLESYAKEKLNNEGVTYKFLGQLKNEEIRELYANNFFDMFLNVSSSEGIPVSIMEAQSAGIPVIATNVGGTGEIVNNQNGLLLDKDFKPYDLYKIIASVIDAQEDWIKKRSLSRKHWATYFNAEKNYKKFIEKINLL